MIFVITPGDLRGAAPYPGLTTECQGYRPEPYFGAPPQNPAAFEKAGDTFRSASRCVKFLFISSEVPGNTCSSPLFRKKTGRTVSGTVGFHSYFT